MSRRAISTARRAPSLDVSGEVVVQAAATPAIKGLEGFTVGLEDETVEAATAEIEEHGTTDAQGRVDHAGAGAGARGAAADSRPRSRCASARPAGAPSSAASRCRSCRRARSSAVRKNFGGDLAEGATATFDVVLASPDGTRLARKGVAWNLYKVERRYQWFNSDGRWGFEPVKSTRRVADGRIDVAAARARPHRGPGRVGHLPPRRARRRRRDARRRACRSRSAGPATRPPTRPTSST